jgi:RNA polymerase sigma factor (TIGR02999 family)
MSPNWCSFVSSERPKQFAAVTESFSNQPSLIQCVERRRILENIFNAVQLSMPCNFQCRATIVWVLVAYIRLIGQESPDFRSRAHFLGIASHIMRQILIDHARSRNAGKRGGGMPKFSLDEALNAAVERPSIMIAIDDALRELERKDPRKTKLIEMRFFGGLTAEESAEILALPVEKVRGELRVAQAWLQRELNSTLSSEK